MDENKVLFGSRRLIASLAALAGAYFAFQGQPVPEEAINAVAEQGANLVAGVLSLLAGGAALWSKVQPDG